MDSPLRIRLPALLPLVLLAVPLHLYVIGDWLGTGVQWALFRYQETAYGPSLITVASDFGYIGTGLISGKTALSFLLWDAGGLLLSGAALLSLLPALGGRPAWTRPAGFAVAAAGVLFTASCIVQYGPLLSGPAGISLPLGLPLVFSVAWLMVRGEDEGDEEEEGGGDGGEGSGP
ncbi:MAG: hypothetical protein QFX32_06285 [Methanolinea sp.]|nr:hypothetical protein [Methanolinea sp.]